MQKYSHDAPVYLGFGNALETDNLYRLRSIFLPLGKIGGKPSWLNPHFLPTTADLECSVCHKAMAFLIQIYATGDSDPPHAFHRTIFIFICRDPQCSKNNDPSNITVFRCCLPRENAFYSFDGPMDPDTDGNVPDPWLSDGAPKLCRICGCYASKKCGRCGIAWYCCRDHQAIDWTTVHKKSCGSDGVCEGSPEPRNPSNNFLFKEYGIDMDQECVPSKLFEDLSEDEDDDEDCNESEDVKQRRISEFQDYLAKYKLRNNEFKAEEMEAAVADQRNDRNFERFNRLLNLYPTQVLRYQRSGNPLLATDNAPPLGSVPDCEKCGAPRHFELQLMPHLLSLIGVDQIGSSIDWASIYIFTCSQTCEIDNHGYVKEFVLKQDFC